MAKQIVISEEVVRTRVMRVHSAKLRESMKHGFLGYKLKSQRRLIDSKLLKKGANHA